MLKLAALILVLATVVLRSEGEVMVPFPVESLLSSSVLNAPCTVKNETFVGWFKVDGNVKIGEVKSRSDVKDKPGVFIETTGNDKTCHLIFPKGSPVTVGGKYECRGDKNKAALTVYVRFSLDSLQRTQTLHIGKNEKIVLGALSYPFAKFKWKKDGTAIDFASNPRLTLENDGSISITSVKESDAGKYDVNVNWENRNTVDEVITVSVKEKPRFLSTPSPNKLTGVEGFDYKFCCNHTGIPKPTLKWYKIQGGAEVEVDVTNPHYSVDGICMSIKTLVKSDAATYKCTSSNSAGQASATVAMEKVGVKPSVDAFTEDSLLKSVNKPLEFECTGKGDPTPSMEWTSGGKVVKNQVQEAGKSTLKFAKLRLEDTANFTCTARNGLFYDGSELHASRDLQLNVIAKPLLNKNKSPSKLYSFLGNRNSVPVRCVFDGFPDPFVNITKNDSLLANGTSQVSLDVMTSKLGDFGEYVCTARNKHGSATYTVTLVQAVAPGKPVDVVAETTCDSVHLSWKKPLSNGGLTILNYVIGGYNETIKYNVDWNIRKHKIRWVFEPETTFEVNISARNLVGIGEPESLTVTTDKYCKPSPPLLSTIGGKRTKPDLTVFGPNLKVTWQKPSDDGFDDDLRYRVEWRVKNGPTENGTKWKKSDLLQETEYELKGLKKGKYEIRVIAVSKAGDSNPDTRVVNVDIGPDLPITTATTAATATTASTSPSFSTKLPETVAEMPTLPDGMTRTTPEPPVAGKRTGGLSKGVIAGIVIAILLIVLITIDLFCCFFNSCGLIFCCQRACCGGKYSPDGKAKKDTAEMEKLNKKPAPEAV